MPWRRFPCAVAHKKSRRRSRGGIPSDPRIVRALPFIAVVGRARAAVCVYPGRSVGRSGRPTSDLPSGAVGRCSRTHQMANAGVHEHTHIQNSMDDRGIWKTGHPHLSNTRRLSLKGRSTVGRYNHNPANPAFLHVTPNFPLFMNKQRRRLLSLSVYLPPPPQTPNKNPVKPPSKTRKSCVLIRRNLVIMEVKHSKCNRKRSKTPHGHVLL